MTLAWREMATKIMLPGLLGALAACGSSVNDSDGRAIVDASVPDLSDVLSVELIDAVSDLDVSLDSGQIDELDAAITPIAADLFTDGPVTAWAGVPATGSADYIGGIELVPDGNEDNRVFGALTASADFSTSRIAGVGRDFYNVRTDDPQVGILALDAEFFRSSDLTSSFGISGALIGNLSGDAIDGDVDIDISADFADGASVIYGGGTGIANSATVDAALVIMEQP